MRPIGFGVRATASVTKCTIEDCDRKHFCRGLCRSHWRRARTGDDSPIQPDYKHETPEQRFWRYVAKGPDCWVWTGAGRERYGRQKIAGRMVQATHYSWELHNGPIPHGLFVCHRCDNPPCVRPDHLFLGTKEDNMRDMVAKGRHRWGHNRPEAA